MRVSSWGSKNLGRVGDESGAEAGLLQREVDELLVREAGAEAAAAAAHFLFRAGTVVRARRWSSDGNTRDERETELGKATRTRDDLSICTHKLSSRNFSRKKSFRHGLFFLTKILPSVAFVTTGLIYLCCNINCN